MFKFAKKLRLGSEGLNVHNLWFLTMKSLICLVRKISKGLGLEADTKIQNVQQNIGLVLVFNGLSCTRGGFKFMK